MLSAFYPGAGTDVFPLVMFRDIKKWIYTDSQPNSEFGDMMFDGCNRPRFIELLLQNMKQNHFELESVNGSSYTFYNKEYEQQVIYETNSVFPRDVQQKHYDCDSIVMCGFDMENETTNFINKFQHIITNSITVFGLEAKQLLSCKNVSTMVYNDDWEYWESKNELPHLIQHNIRVEKNNI
jgi:hypothetical protein